MKLKLFIVLFLLLGLKSYSQNNLQLYNLYYLSKYITADNLSNKKDSVYNALIVSIGTKKAKEILDHYQNSTPEEKNSDYIGAFLDKKQTDRQNQITAIINDFYNPDFITKYKDKVQILGLQVELNQLATDYLTLPLDVKNNPLKKIIFSLDSIKKSMAVQKLSKVKITNPALLPLFKIPDSISKQDIDTALEENKKIIKLDSVTRNTYNTKVAHFANAYLTPQGGAKEATKQTIKSNEIEYTKTQIDINSIVQPAEQRAASTSFSLPSESDLINAMAIFLAKRAQQEAAIWFMDQLREHLNNPLIYEAFPETIKLIKGLEDYKTPSFNTAWRYAIAADFVKMPKNLANSSWITTIVFDNKPEKAGALSSSVNFGYDLNRLISEKYNYRDIIRYFYTNPDFDYNSASKNFSKNNEVQKLLNRSISILYILTNDFFSIDKQDNKQSFRLLSYEEIRSLNQSQWLALGQLLKAKYGSKFDNTSNFFEKDFVDNQESLSKWMGNLLITLSQFDKVNTDFQKALEGKNDVSNYNFYNVWQITSQIIENINYNKYLQPDLPNTISQPNQFNTTIIKDCIDIYDQIQNRNFSTGIQKTMSLIKEISIANSNYNLHEFYLNGIKIEFDNNGLSFSIKVNKTLLNPKITGNDLKITIKNDKIDKSVDFTNFSKIKPFLKFVKKTDNDDTYNLLKSIDENFDQNITLMSSETKLDKISIIELLKIVSQFDINELTSDKFAAFLRNSKNIGLQSTISNTDVEKLKNKYQNQLFKVTAFFADVLAAKNQQELANVIDSHALPPTSYKLKRRVPHSIDLNAYVGAQFSGLTTNGYTSLKDQFTAGITAPIGFAFTWTTRGPRQNNYGFTVDVVDLGNIVNHYLVSSTYNYEPDVHFSEIFSPAFSGMYSLKNTPFVLFGSVKFLPLKTTTVSETLLNNKTFDATIFSVGVKIDIPLVNLWTKTEYDEQNK